MRDISTALSDKFLGRDVDLFVAVAASDVAPTKDDAMFPDDPIAPALRLRSASNAASASAESVVGATGAVYVGILGEENKLPILNHPNINKWTR